MSSIVESIFERLEHAYQNIEPKTKSVMFFGAIISAFVAVIFTVGLRFNDYFDVSAVKVELEKANTKIQTLENKGVESEEKLAEKNTAALELTGTINERGLKILNLKENLNNVNSINVELGRKNDQLQGESQRANELQTKNSELNDSVAWLNRRVSTLEAMLFTDDELELLRDQRPFVESINARLDKIEIVSYGGPRIEGKQRAIYIIREKNNSEVEGNGLFHFNSQSFNVLDRSLGRITATDLRLYAKGICDVARFGALGPLEGISFRDLLSHLEAKYNPAGISLLERNDVSMLLEFDFLMRLLRRDISNASVLIIGYADSTREDWSQPLVPGPVGIQIHPFVRTEDTVDVYAALVDEIYIGRPTNNSFEYKNDDLPSLRSNEVKNQLKFLSRDCNDGYSLEVLEGGVLEQSDPRERYVLAYLVIELDTN